MKKILSAAILTSLAVIPLQGTCLDGLNSLILSPQIGTTVKTSTPVIVGIMKNTGGKPIKNKKITLFVADGNTDYKLGTVSTNKYGVWSYPLKAHQALSDGFHSIQASIKLSLTHPFWSKGTIFNVQADDAAYTPHKSGNVNSDNSFINYPFEGSASSTATPTIVGSLLDSSYRPVAGETVTIQIDAITVGSPISDSNGVFVYALTTGLSEDAHTVDAHCVESSADLTTNNFTVDVAAPDAPVIVAPTENETVTTSLVTVSGTTEEWATVTTYIDGDTYGDVCYADENGDWLSTEYVLADGNHAVTAQASDLGNNTGELCDARNFIVEEIVS